MQGGDLVRHRDAPNPGLDPWCVRRQGGVRAENGDGPVTAGRGAVTLESQEIREV